MLGPPSVVVGGNKPVVLPLSSIYSPPFAFTSVTALKSKKEMLTKAKMSFLLWNFFKYL